ncbi:MAG: hypothetical protein LBE18_07280 [Planctomycetaceae bacterium]|jgi:Tfp pilus assembly protein FimT|nr:hypothetical protein [Planctomycetaceae bacterium]
MRRKNCLSSVFYAMTLVELLVVMTIMVILVAVSVPSLKPMLESQRAANGARVVALKLQQARIKAMRENKPCGVEFMRYDNDNKISLQMRNVKDVPNFNRLNEDDGREVKCRVIDNGNNTGTITLVKKRPEDSEWIAIDPEGSADVTWRQRVLRGLTIQFNRQGKHYYLSDSFTVNNYNAGNLPTSATDPPVEFNVTQRPSSMLNVITVLPRGTVVDLQHSEYRTRMTSTIGGSDFTFSSANATHINRSVIIMFSPTGYVDRFYVDGTENQGNDRPFRGVFYLLIGEWDKIDSGEDGKNNEETESNFWVTIKDRDGTVRISPNSNDPADRTRHAREDLFNNIGGL